MESQCRTICRICVVFVMICVCNCSIGGDFEEKVLVSILGTFRRDPIILDFGVKRSTIKLDQTEKTVSSIGRYRSDGKRISYVKDTKEWSRYDLDLDERLFWHGELVRMCEQRASPEKMRTLGLENPYRSLDFESPRANSAVRPRSGDIVTHTHCPMIGCIDGYFFEEYFPVAPATHIEIDGERATLQSTTHLGFAVCTFDLNKACLPVELEIKKSGDHFLSQGRLLKNIKFDPKVAKSALTRGTIALRDVVVKKDPLGKFYIDSCKISEEYTSERGTEGKTEYEWNVKSIDTNPKFERGQIRPEFAVSDGERFSALDASHLPFAWSTEANWVVPLVPSLEKATTLQRNSRFLIAIVAVGSVLVVGWFLRKRNA